MACPGSVALSEGLPDRTTIYAQEGTAAHDLGERVLRTPGDSADAHIGEIITVDRRDGNADEIEVTEEMAEAVQVYVDFVRAAVYRPSHTKPLIGCVGALYLEREFSLEKLDPPTDMFGTSDAIIWHSQEAHLHVVDYKHGKGVAVDVVGNKQLAYYALGAMLALEVLPDTITMTIVQPRAAHRDGRTRSHTITFEELKAFKHTLFEAAEETQKPNAALVPGDHCRFCKAAAICPAIKAKAVEVAQSEFTAFTPPAPATLSRQDLLTVLGAADLLTDWVKAVEAHAFGLLEQGEELEGWKLVEKRATRKWVDEAEVARLLEEKHGVKDAAFTLKLKSPAQVEALLKSRKEKLDEELAQQITKQSSGVKMARDTDPRPAELPSAQTDFDIPVEAETAGR